MLTEQQVKRIVQQELAKNSASSRFQLNSIPQHVHNGTDSPQIKAENIIPSLTTSGSITFGTEGATYTIKLNSNFTPSNILAYGTVTDSASSPTIRCHTIGSAQLISGFKLQPETNRSVVTGGPQYPFPTEQPNGTTPTVPLQSSSFIYANESSGAIRAGVSEEHIVSVFIGDAIADIRARVTIIDFSKTAIKLYVPYLTAGWRINVNYVIT